MIHELLLALCGHTGSIFIADATGKSKYLEVSNSVIALHPSERELLSRLAKIGGLYRYFQNYATTGLEGRHPQQPSLYIRALCYGLQELLREYTNNIVDMEADILAETHNSVTEMEARLHDYQLLFPAVERLLDEVDSREARGCYVLELLHRHAASGIPVVARSFNRIQRHCHSLLIKQLATWMLHGLLYDIHGEFFIQSDGVPRVEEVKPEDEDDLGIGGLSGSQLRDVLQFASDNQGFATPGLPFRTRYSPGQPSRTRYFSVREDLRPSYVPPWLADKILFIGESVRLSEQNTARPVHLGVESLLRGRQDEFAEELARLESSDLDINELSTVVESIRVCVSNSLWTLVVDRGQLLHHLLSLKGFYLLGRGDFAQTFISMATRALEGPVTKTTLHDATALFKRAADCLGCESDPEFNRFSFRLIDDPKSNRSGFDTLSLSYSSVWPAHILINDNALEKYDSMFRFLLAVKRSQLVLNDIWAAQMARRKPKYNRTDKLQWELHSRMAFLVNSLQFYFHIDVLESEFCALQSAIRSTDDFDVVRHAHDSFLSAILSQSFLLLQPVAGCISEVIRLSVEFQSVITSNYPEERLSSELNRIKQLFVKNTNLLFRLLSNVKGHQTNPHLTQLLLRLDYNGFYTRNHSSL